MPEITLKSIGNVVGPASSTDNAFPRFDGTSGKVVQNGQTTEDDSGNLVAYGGMIVNNSAEATGDFQVKGDTIDYTFLVDVSRNNVAMGTSVTQVTIDGVNFTPTLTMSRPDSGTALNQALLSDSNTAARGPFNQFLRARRSAGAFAAVQSGDSGGIFRFSGHDGTQFITSAYIQFLVDGTVGTGAVPSNIQFFTMNSGGTIARRLCVTPDGKVMIGNSTAPDSFLEVEGSFGLKVTSHNSSTLTLDDTHYFVAVDYTATGAVTITLPSAASAYNGARNVGRVYEIKDSGCNAAANNITINRAGSDTIIDTATGGTSVAIATSGQTLRIAAKNGSTWMVVGRS